MDDLATCIVCGKKYEACLSCKEQLKIRPWQRITDTAECYKIFLALSQYNNGYITKEDAKNELGQITYVKSELYDNIQRSIDKIIGDTDELKSDLLTSGKVKDPTDVESGNTESSSEKEDHSAESTSSAPESISDDIDTSEPSVILDVPVSNLSATTSSTATLSNAATTTPKKTYKQNKSNRYKK